MTKMRRLVSLVGLLILVAVPAARAGEPVCDRVVSVADLHGGYDAFVGVLHETGLTDEENRWIGGRSCLVQLGDVLDRGPRSREILDLIMELQSQAPGRVEMLLGNHEVMNMVGDLRYTDRGEFLAFADEEKPGEREKRYREFLESGFATGDDANDRKVFDEWFPPGWFAHRRAFSPDGKYGRWLLERPVMKIVNRTLYVHGGVTEDLAREGVDEVNREVVEEIREFTRLREGLVKAGMLHPLTPFMVSFEVVRVKLDELKTSLNGNLNPALVAEAKRFLALNHGMFFSSEGPLWNRDLAQEDDAYLVETLPVIFDKLAISRIVVGHTTENDGRIHARAGNRVFLTDTGAGPAYGGHVSALVIDWRGKVRAVYPGEVDVLVDPPPSDADMERFLLEGKIIDSREIGTGITRPKHVVLEMHGRTVDAAFKYVDLYETKATRYEGSVMELGFSDSYKNELSAYLLDRWLGLQMVPTTVIRTIDGQEGALIFWISDAIPEHERRERGESPPDPRVLSRQRDIMYLFDALIANTDRNLSNQLITTHDWRLHLIDHSRSFRLNKHLSQAFLDNPISLPQSLLTRLAAMQERPLRDLLKGLVSKAQIKALLARRDRILEKIADDRRRYGDAMVFHELQPPLHMQPSTAATGGP